MKKYPLWPGRALGLILLLGGLGSLLAQENEPEAKSDSAAGNPQVAAVARELNLSNLTLEAALQKAAKVVTYKTVQGVPLEIHVFMPEGLKPDERRPALLFFHGGSWVTGDPSVHALECLYFSRLGMVTATASYRLIPHTPKPGEAPSPAVPRAIAQSPADCLADAKSAMRYFRSHAADFQVDPNKIVGCGGSAGGHLAAALGSIKGYDDAADDQSISTRPDALILCYPAIDLVSGWKGGKAIAQKKGLDLTAFSPALQVEKNYPPTLVLAGTKDPISTEATDRQYIERIKAVGGDAELVEFEGRGHKLFLRSPDNAHFQAAIYFMDEFLTRLGYLPKHASLPPPVIEYQTLSTKP